MLQFHFQASITILVKIILINMKFVKISLDMFLISTQMIPNVKNIKFSQTDVIFLFVHISRYFYFQVWIFGSCCK